MVRLILTIVGFCDTISQKGESMSMSYNEALNQYKSGFDEKSWKKHERNKKKLKSFAKVKFVGKSLYPIENLKAPNDVFMKRFKYIALSQIQRNSEAVRNMRMINEILIPIFCKQIGLEGATYLGFREDENKPNYESIIDVMKSVKMTDGLVSLNFLKEGEELFSDWDLYDYGSKSGYSFEELLERIKTEKRKDAKLKFDINDIKIKFFKLIVLDLLTLQLDRHEGNLPLILNKNNNTVHFGMVFDNEYAFNIKSLENYNLENDDFEMLKADCKVDMKKFILHYNRRLKHGDDYIWTISSNCNMDYMSCLRDIVKLTIVSPTAKNLLTEVLAKLSVENAFEELTGRGVKVSKQYESFVSQIVGFGKAQFVKEIAKADEKKKGEIVSNTTEPPKKI